MSSKPHRPEKASGDKAKPEKRSNRPKRRGADAAWVASPIIFAIIFGTITIAQAVDGHWNTWWVKWLCIPSLIAGIAFAVGELLYRYFSCSKKQSILFACVVVMLLTIASLLLYSRLSGTERVTWQPPKLPVGCKEVFLTFGGVRFQANVADLQTTKHSYRFESIPFLHLRIRDNRFYVKALSDHAAADEAFMINTDTGKRRQFPPGWDENYTSTAYEVVDEKRSPRFQLFYRRPNEVAVRGFFVHESPTFGRRLFIARDDQDLIIQKLPDTNRIQITEQRLRPIFKYPSFKHQGEYADN